MVFAILQWDWVWILCANLKRKKTTTFISTIQHVKCIHYPPGLIWNKCILISLKLIQIYHYYLLITLWYTPITLLLLGYNIRRVTIYTIHVCDWLHFALNHTNAQSEFYFHWQGWQWITTKLQNRKFCCVFMLCSSEKSSWLDLDQLHFVCFFYQSDIKSEEIIN